MPNKRARRLSNVEKTILGLTWNLGPCSTYAVMKQLSTSASTYYKSRAGTTYSVVERLSKFGLIEQTSDATDGEKLIQVTAAGIEELKGWLTPPIPMPDIAHSADLLRARFFFIGVLESEQRLAFIENALEGLRGFLEICEQLPAANEEVGDHFGALASLSVILETKARIQWLETVRDELK